MKRLVTSLVVCAILAGTVLFFSEPRQTFPSIAVVVGDQTGGGSQFLPAVDGYVSGIGSGTQASSGKVIWTLTESYKVVSSSPGHLFVLAHYEITRDGNITRIDKALPVFTKEPDPIEWSKLDDHLTAHAYLCATTLNY